MEAQQPGWSVEFYTDARGRSPAYDFLWGLPNRERSVVLRVIDLLEQHGVTLGMPHARPVAEFWELRAGANRLFYVAHVGRRFIILHGYRKKSQRTPQGEIETARRRWRDFQERAYGR